MTIEKTIYNVSTKRAKKNHSGRCSQKKGDRAVAAFWYFLRNKVEQNQQRIKFAK
jgi:hypothetical protein